MEEQDKQPSAAAEMWRKIKARRADDGLNPDDLNENEYKAVIGAMTPEERRDTTERLGAVCGMTPEQLEVFRQRAAELEIAEAQADGNGLTTILVCQCQCTTMEVQRVSRTAVALKCPRCGLKTSVKGAVASVHVEPDELAAAIRTRRTDPDPSGNKGKGKGKGDGDDGDDGDEDGEENSLGARGWVHLRFRLTTEQAEVVHRALEVLRVLHAEEDPYTGNLWQGTALEWIAADFLAGASPEAIRVVQEIEDAAAEAAAAAEAEEGITPAKIKKRIRELRGRLRVTKAREAGLIETPESFTPPGFDAELADARSADAAADAEAEPDERALDEGKLRESVLSALSSWADECAATWGTRPDFLVVDPGMHGDAQKRWQAKGGFLCRALGDPRTRTKAGRRPEIWFWVNGEPDQVALDVAVEYDGAIDLPGGSVAEVVELLPPGYSKLPDDQQWEKPHFADRREELIS
jgi:hypothetical protein